MYFRRFPKMQFLLTPPSYKKAPEYINLVDITSNVRFKREVINNIIMYDWYHIRNGETPEIVSENLYGTPHYNWIIMLLNDVYDYRRDWVIDDESFNKYIVEKYGSVEEAQGLVNHYIDRRGLIVDQGNVGIDGIHDATTVYAFDYEHQINESKRKIKILSENLLEKVLRNFKDLMT